MSVTFASNGDLVLNERNLEACNMLEYYAVTVYSTARRPLTEI